MKQHRIIIIALTGILLASSAVCLWSQGNRSYAPHYREMREGRDHFRTHMIHRHMVSAQMLLNLKDELSLTESQLNKIRDLQSRHAKDNIDLESKIKLQRVELQELLTRENINRQKIEAVLTELGDLKTRFEISLVNHLLDLKDVLTDDQQKKLESMKNERRREFWDRRRESFRREKNR